MTQSPRALADQFQCAECSMLCIPGEYHPYAACLMYKACHNSATVRANLSALRAQAPAQPGKPVAWRREWEGDDSDLGMWIYHDVKEELEEPLNRWQPLYAAPASAPQAVELGRQAVKLWKLLDDIDTLDDAIKSNDENFRKRCYAIQRKRFAVMSGEQYDALCSHLAALPEEKS